MCLGISKLSVAYVVPNPHFQFIEVHHHTSELHDLLNESWNP
jgi:hypothetical protein